VTISDTPQTDLSQAVMARGGLGLFGRIRGLFGARERTDTTPAAAAIGGPGVLAVSGLRKSYGGRTVVSEASLFVRQGEAVGLLGPNGAGKTTIFYMITGLVPADLGVISLEGNDITDLPMYQRARHSSCAAR